MLWLLQGADSGDICASCCSAIVETLKVNYNINDSALQAVVPYYASIIPCMGTQGIAGKESAGSAANSGKKKKRERIFFFLRERRPGCEDERLLGGLLVQHLRRGVDWMTDSLSPRSHPSLHLSRSQPPTPDPPTLPPSLRRRRRYFRQHLFDLAALYS